MVDPLVIVVEFSDCAVQITIDQTILYLFVAC